MYSNFGVVLHTIFKNWTLILMLKIIDVYGCLVPQKNSYTQSKVYHEVNLMSQSILKSWKAHTEF